MKVETPRPAGGGVPAAAGPAARRPPTAAFAGSVLETGCGVSGAGFKTVPASAEAAIAFAEPATEVTGFEPTRFAGSLPHIRASSTASRRSY